jgi:hypothetical protein
LIREANIFSVLPLIQSSNKKYDLKKPIFPIFKSQSFQKVYLMSGPNLRNPVLLVTRHYNLEERGLSDGGPQLKKRI